ncbi:NUDIX hydrolase [Halostagnicola kamekurae]|uniref:ADP-ribose pyrophosphatase YjhB, NUDIX family n=1 Tax=Halostagnicola kamekurae TaxID=619731 RepID=A0A1I6RTI2_9EURY|nr:NUDIX domain-containing protein [Halostagnicola kamekurae]SFS67982.1 ADP-ribose pyrophosphatase YjhB, NUDIX family [Halostagnicola kamekurae]
METTRHFTVTLYIVNDGATALHAHDKLGKRIPPGGHIDRDELPHEAAIRECREETGLEASIPRVQDSLESDAGRSLPQPRRQMLYDVDVYDGAVGHQHIDHVYFGSVPSREIDPGPGEAGVDAWAWYAPDELRASDLDADVIELGCAAIDAVAQR